MNKWKTLKSFSQVVEAQIVQSYLESNSVSSRLLNKHIVSINWLYSNLVGGVQLQVREDVFEEAKRLVENPPAVKLEVVPGPTCPKCESPDSEINTAAKRGRWRLLIDVFLIPLPWFLKDQWLCKSCGNTWKV